MLYRLTMIGITAFWLVMMGLLVRLETHPETTDILDVPVAYVARLMLMHGQQSLLTVSEEGKRVGSVALRPRMTAEGKRSFEFSGALSLQLPMAARQRFSFNGVMDVDAALRALDFHLEAGMQEPRLRLDVSGDMARNSLSWQLIQGNQPSVTQTVPMSAAAIGQAVIQNLGIEPGMLPTIAPGNIAAPAVTAREAQITLHGEQLEVYRVTVQEGTAPVADFYVSQLGQIVLATTSFGYTLTAEDYQ